MKFSCQATKENAPENPCHKDEDKEIDLAVKVYGMFGLLVIQRSLSS